MQEIDLRIGAAFTRFQTMLLRDAFIIDAATDGRNLVLSYGPCQVCRLRVTSCAMMLLIPNIKVLGAYAFVLFHYSFPHLALLLNATGKYNHMCQKNFGQLTVHINQMKALLLSVGCKI